MEYHVSIKGSDQNLGSESAPFKTISKAATVAQPGDIVTVHEGIYREWVNPARGGTETQRIVYQAASKEKVTITGAEIIKDWSNIEGNIWKTVIPNSFFGNYNPYKEIIQGDWLYPTNGETFHTGEIYLNGKSMYETSHLDGVKNPVECEQSLDKSWSTHVWYCEAGDKETAIWANFQGEDPGKDNVEINVRPFVFWPKENLLNYITVRGFTLKQAATNWAPPTALQVGLIGPHWAKGWIIEDNIISDSKCCGVSLGKEIGTGHNEWSKLRFKQGTQREREVIFRAAKGNWNKETIGSHIVRNNTIFNCEQAGVVGHLGAVFSTIENNHIYQIQVKAQYSGAEVGGIKIHAAIDATIRENVIHDCVRGIWLDWQAQGTHVTKNIFYNNTLEDLYIEVSHGPYLVDHNLFLSPFNYREYSQGGALVHNLFTGKLTRSPEMSRFTPYHFPHETEIAGVMTIAGGDERCYNNLFVGDKDVDLPEEPASLFSNISLSRLPPEVAKDTRSYIRKPMGTSQYDDCPSMDDPKPWERTPPKPDPSRLPDASLLPAPIRNHAYRPGMSSGMMRMDAATLPVSIKHNVYLNGAKPYVREPDPVVTRECGVEVKIDNQNSKVVVAIARPSLLKCPTSELVTTKLLGMNHHAEMLYEEKDGTPYMLDKDLLGKQRSAKPTAGPFELSGDGSVTIELSYHKKN
jgi:hypothetical protein